MDKEGKVKGLANKGCIVTDHTDTEQLAIGTVSDVSITPNQRLAAKRKIAKRFFDVGEPVEVVIEFIDPNNFPPLPVIETLPSGWIAANISTGGIFNDGTIIRAAENSAIPQLSYTAIPPWITTGLS